LLIINDAALRCITYSLLFSCAYLFIILLINKN
jgi:hypothetical protein